MSLVLAMGGDVVVTRPLAAARAKPGARRVFDELREAAGAIANLEIPLCDGGAPVEKLVTHRAAPSLAADLAAGGFRTLVLANNHACDYGPAGLLETIGHLREAGITPLGAGEDLAEALAPAYVEEGSVRAAVLAVSALLPAGCAATAQRPGIAPVRVDTRYEIDPAIHMEQPGHPPDVRTSVRAGDLARLCEAVASARERATHVVVYVHWGVGMQQTRAEYQQPLGRALVEAGADLVVGCHAHTIQQIERYRDGFIFYSLGECFSQYDRSAYPPEIAALMTGIRPEGFLVRASLRAGGRPDLELIPLAIDGDGDPSADSSERVVEKIRAMCEVPARYDEGSFHLET